MTEQPWRRAAHRAGSHPKPGLSRGHRPEPGAAGEGGEAALSLPGRCRGDAGAVGRW